MNIKILRVNLHQYNSALAAGKSCKKRSENQQHSQIDLFNLTRVRTHFEKRGV